MYQVRDHQYTQARLALDVMLCMLSQNRAIGLQTDCMVIVPAPVVRLPDSHVYALWGPSLRIATHVIIRIRASAPG